LKKKHCCIDNNGKLQSNKIPIDIIFRITFLLQIVNEGFSFFFRWIATKSGYYLEGVFGNKLFPFLQIGKHPREGFVQNEFQPKYVAQMSY
jgi:hypothetical protein